MPGSNYATLPASSHRKSSLRSSMLGSVNNIPAKTRDENGRIMGRLHESPVMPEKLVSKCVYNKLNITSDFLAL